MLHTILIGEDEPVQQKILAALLTKKLGYKIILTENGREVLQHIEASNIGEISVVLLDLQMPEMDGLETLKWIHQHRPDLPVVILTAQDDTATAVEAIKAGASDFIVKPANPAQLDISLKNAFRLSSLSRELTRLKRDREGALGFEDLVGHDTGLSEAVSFARKAAASDVAVLITGEISTGKELLARAIHGESRRVGAPFIPIHCGTLPEQSVESVLFGQEKGIFGGVRSAGKFREAERGTLFLDDIHALSPDAQVKLLRVLQEREVQPVGAEKPVKVNVRVISATDRDLKSEVKAGRFREDLYFRLNVLTIAMPPLRERKGDILPLVDYFLHRLSLMDALPLKRLTADARHYLADYAWPGNMRELQGLLHRALVLSQGDSINRSLLKEIHETETMLHDMPTSETHIALNKPNGLPKTMREIEEEVIEKSLKHNEHNISHTAEMLGMAKSTFYRKIKKLH